MTKVTVDSGANLKILKSLENLGLLEIAVVNLENGKVNKIKDKVGPVGVLGKDNWGDGSVWGDNNCIYKELLSIIGGSNYQDARQLEAHYRSKNDYFITEDKGDILSKKEILKKIFNIVVMSPVELKDLFTKETNE